MKTGSSQHFVEFLKGKGFSAQEIRVAVDIRVHGIVMTKAIYKFTELYDKHEIDGFPDSALEILQMYYGKKLNTMKRDTLVKKVLELQKSLTENADEEFVNEAVDYFLN